MQSLQLHLTHYRLQREEDVLTDPGSQLREPQLFHTAPEGRKTDKGMDRSMDGQTDKLLPDPWP